MGVIQSLAESWEQRSSAGVDVSAASLFLRAQASWLCRALSRSDDSTAVGLVLGAHDTCHETWLGLIAAVERCCGEAAAQEVAALYSFHGRVVGSLERGLDRRLEDEVAGQVRTVLAERLRDLTESAIGRLNGERAAKPVRAVTG